MRRLPTGALSLKVTERTSSQLLRTVAQPARLPFTGRLTEVMMIARADSRTKKVGGDHVRCPAIAQAGVAGSESSINSAPPSGHEATTLSVRCCLNDACTVWPGRHPTSRTCWSRRGRADTQVIGQTPLGSARQVRDAEPQVGLLYVQRLGRAEHDRACLREHGYGEEGRERSDDSDGTEVADAHGVLIFLHSVA
ncbi:MAG: hypothetical protein JWM90_1950 [Thermoleophilia bacterium]|nr:hypothetical protein [Thermoleophilia bacterium]